MIGPSEDLRHSGPTRLRPRWGPHLVNICEESAVNGFGNVLIVPKSIPGIVGVTVAIVVVIVA